MGRVVFPDKHGSQDHHRPHELAGLHPKRHCAFDQADKPVKKLTANDTSTPLTEGWSARHLPGPSIFLHENKLPQLHHHV